MNLKHFPRTIRPFLLMAMLSLFFACASQSQVTVMLPGDVPLVLVKIPKGAFMMGAPNNELGGVSKQVPRHQVTISENFYMGKYEVTKAQWTAVMGTTPWSGIGTVLNDSNSPAVFVSWNDINSVDGFMDKLNEHLGTIGQPYRLPTEAEWEYACRANTTTRFYWGEDPNYTEIDFYAWWGGNTLEEKEKYAHTVGQKRPNTWGLYDMSGNVWEWCQDRYGRYVSSAQTDPTGDDSNSYRVLRGGGWYYDGNICRSAYRNSGYPDFRGDCCGFRIVRTQP